MPKAPPLLPEEALERVLRHARLNGMWVLVVGSTFALLGASGGELLGVLAWLLVAGTGAMALHGATLLHQGEPRGTDWLVGGQLFCLTFILALCAWQLTHADLTPLRVAVTDDMRASLKQTGLTEDEFLLLSYRLTYGLVALGAILYPGGLALYFHRRRDAVTTALTAESE
jgi:hypothetical protein